MKKFYKLSVVAVLGLFLFAGFPNLYNNIYHSFKDRLAWADMKSMLKGKHVVSVELFGLSSKNVVLDEPNKEKILNSLRQAKFKESNWRQHGPTPDIVVILKFNDGTKESFSYWGGKTFETSYKDSQFLISGLDLETIVKNKALIKDGAQVKAVGIFQPKNDKGNSSENLYKATYRLIPKEDFVKELAYSYETNPSQVLKPYEVSKFLSIAFTDGETATAHILKNEQFMFLRKNNHPPKKYTVSSNLIQLADREFKNSTYPVINAIMYKGSPYSAAALSASMDPKELEPIGTLDNTTYYILRNKDQPADLIYYVSGKAGWPKGNYNYHAFKRIY